MNTAVVIFLKKSPFALYAASFIYSLFHGSNVWRYVFNKNVKIKGAFLKHTKINVVKGGKLYLGARCQMNHCQIKVLGGGILVNGRQTCINNASLLTRESDSLIEIGEDFSMQGGTIQSVKPIRIGNHCMLSWDIEIMSSDLHPIFLTENNQLINQPKGIIIQDHVWISAHARVLKGSFIVHDVVVGNSSLVAGKLENSYSVYAGIPARCIKKDINWSRSWNEL